MKIWVDDEREPPRQKELWTLWCKTYEQAISAILDAACSGEIVTQISLSDLGEGKSGYDVFCFIEERFHHNKPITIQQITCHSMNPVGRRNIMAGIRNLREKGYVK